MFSSHVLAQSRILVPHATIHGPSDMPIASCILEVSYSLPLETNNIHGKHVSMHFLTRNRFDNHSCRLLGIPIIYIILHTGHKMLSFLIIKHFCKQISLMFPLISVAMSMILTLQQTHGMMSNCITCFNC